MAKLITEDLIARTTCPPGKVDVLVFDSRQEGLFLKVTRAGRKVLGVQYMVNGRNRRIMFGEWKAKYDGYWLADAERGKPHTLTAVKAREIASRVRAQRASDPFLLQKAWEAQQRDTASSAVDAGPPLDHIFSQYLDAERRKPLTLKQYRRLYARHLHPVLGPVPINEWDHTTARQLKAHAEAGVATRQKAAPARLHWPGRSVRKTTANRVQVLASGLCSFCIARHYRDAAKGNPFSGKSWHQETQRDRYFTTAQVAAILRACDDLDDERPAFDAIRLLALTGARKNEVLGLKWDAIHWNAFTAGGADVATITLTDSKTGRSVRPLSPQAVELLRAIPRRDAVYVFPGRYPETSLTDVHKVWKAVCTIAGVEGGLHSLRHAFGHAAAVAGAGALTIGKALGHKRKTTAERYADPGLAAAHIVATQVGDAVTAALLQPVDRLVTERGCADDPSL